MYAPEEVMGEFLSRRRFEAFNATALRVEVLHHMANRSVLSGGIHTLQYNEQRVGSRSEQQLLQAVELSSHRAQYFFTLRFIKPRIMCGINSGKLPILARCNRC